MVVSGYRRLRDPFGYGALVLRMSRQAFDEIVDLAVREYPLEACGLLAGTDIDGEASAPTFHACRNLAASAKLYTVDPADHLRAERAADDADLDIIGVVHSHTHTEPYPSATDVRDAPDPGWHYVIVSLKRDAPEMRSYRIVDGQISEERLVIE
jgi:proteasome lid subunit RPN8/RPN11